MHPLLKSLRLRQWTKNLVVFAGLAFSGRASVSTDVRDALLTFVAFCLASSAVYLFNDIVDRERDRLHPAKRDRPLAAGTLTPATAAAAGLLLLAAGVALSWNAGAAADAVLAYVVLQVLYSSWLKHLVVIDVFAIAAGFTLRVLAGVWAIDAPLSPWLIACTLQLALFLALCKRRAEAVSVEGGDDFTQRPILAEYQGGAADVMVSVVPAAQLGATPIDPTSQAGAPGMVWTLPFVFYGVLRYLYLVYRRDQGQRPEWIATTDLPILLTVLGYAVVVARVVYA